MNLDQDIDLQNLITLKGAGKLAGKAKAAGFFQNLDQDIELQNLIRADKIEKALTDLTTIINDAKNLKDSIRDFNKLQNLDQNTELQMIGLLDPDLQNLGW